MRTSRRWKPVTYRVVGSVIRQVVVGGVDAMLDFFCNLMQCHRYAKGIYPKQVLLLPKLLGQKQFCSLYQVENIFLTIVYSLFFV